ncbi:hypothetical protein ACIQRW_08650 [Streptomyces sp. NPDC091287]|uniref:hypothetical protein n=1 Tax=Streptomyces sp. NPDC091287 TaxID=3365988 RepID=UPI0037FFA36D
MTDQSEAWPPGEILAAYDWQDGACFRCRDGARSVAHIATVTAPGGASVRLLMCGSCILREEELRLSRAIATGATYVPGRIGRSPDS